ncbi:pseudaminic acid synthase [Chitinophaga oryzae]|uniref:Pseudaminic acid synthase n=1 Tax=Chitinophaga oryzae TaxID=2725414 RepID=A0AAE6ZJZ0_9BACT|nr:pseudaminic acid synthase [Chitinophaga oryzae]QJB34109.1 pseudaminic acid synthase [Chitinophaga oryzae]QJB40628.1 pseudaminic acid synthase [Chitinophaga oryzae]
MKIANFVIAPDSRPFVIAEMSGNHNQSLERALQIVKAAADSGAHAIKLQTYTPDTLTIDHRGGLFDITDEHSLWKGRNLYDLYKEAMTPYEWHKPIFEYAKELGVLCFSTPFDENAVDMLDELGAPCHKIASFENNHHPLLRKIAKTGKPVIMSTGISALGDIEESVGVLRSNGCQDLALLKCTSSYPATPENTNIVTIPHMREMFKCEVGLSDHTMGVGAAVAAVALGARIIEKHFCLSRAEGGVDSAFSLEPDEFKLLVTETERAFLALGEVQYGIMKAEEKSLRYKRSVYVIKDINEGELLTPENISIIRPGDGLAPKYYERLLGRPSKQKLQRGTPLTWDLI